MDVGQLGSERGEGEWTSAGLNAHLVAVVEAPTTANQDAAAAAASAAAGSVQLGLVAVEMSTGDVLHSQFWCAAAHPITFRGLATADTSVAQGFSCIVGCMSALASKSALVKGYMNRWFLHEAVP